MAGKNKMDNKVIVTGIIIEEDAQYITIETKNGNEVVGYVGNQPSAAKGIKVMAEGFLKRNHLEANIFYITKITKME